VSELRLPLLHGSPFSLKRSGLHWLHRSGEQAGAREPIAVCKIELARSRDVDLPVPFREERNDLQVVLAPRSAGKVEHRADLSKGGFRDLISTQEWDHREVVGSLEPAADSCQLVALVLAGRRGFDNGEGRGSLLAGWHDRTRGFWEGDGSGRFGTVLSLGTCEMTGVFRGEDMAFLKWFANAPGPAQVVSVADERTVHSSAVLLQHLRRTPAEAMAITDAVHSWIGERMALAGPKSFPAFQPDAWAGTLHGRWPEAQDILFALHLVAEAVGASPILERTEVLTRHGVVEQGPPDAIALSMGSEFAPHFRHRRTGWIVAIHGFRFREFIGPGVIEWLRRDFERVHRSIADSERDLAALADTVAARTGAALLVQNLIASSAADRIPNYAWLGDSFAESAPIVGTEANLMISGLTRHPAISVIDSDALAVDLGVRYCPDRIHASRELLDAQRDEYQRVLRERGVNGF
jgi:hypothetical protein